MTKRLISTGSPYEKSYGYSRAVVQGDWCFVAGTTGYDYAAMTMPEDPAEQARNIFRTIEATLTEAGFAMTDIVRARYYLTDVAFRDVVMPVVGEAFGEIRPAATLVVAGLATPEMKVEIEVDAFRG